MNIRKVFHDTDSTLVHRAKLTISHNCSNYKTSESQASVFSLSMIGSKSFMAQEAIHCQMFAHIDCEQSLSSPNFSEVGELASY